MHLTELEPRWIEKDGRKIGVVFLCPHCIANKISLVSPLTVYWEPLHKIAGDTEDSQYGLLAKLKPTFGAPYDEISLNEFVPAKRDYAWGKTGDNFSVLTLTPSVDASASGHWHGFITNGEAS